jgi:hypothetical protein
MDVGAHFPILRRLPPGHGSTGLTAVPTRYTSCVPTPRASADVPDRATDRVARRNLAEDIARKHSVDAGDVEHVLSNLTLPPIERLRRSLRRARLGRPARK